MEIIDRLESLSWLQAQGFKQGTDFKALVVESLRVSHLFTKHFRIHSGPLLKRSSKRPRVTVADLLGNFAYREAFMA
jgi:hypothetical protein